jgi:bifunctional UDP-N-acetylglucosamine pyrophosphorylase/glucosamine-1-phosphate N-acetyltransferase
MRSARPKALHRLCGRPMVRYVLDALEALPLGRVVVVVGHGADRVVKELQDTKPVTDLVEQVALRGTGDAVLAGLAAFADDDLDPSREADDVLILPADVPLLRAETLVELVDAHRRSGAAATIMTTRSADAVARMRVVRGGRDDEVMRVVDHRDLLGDDHEIEEIASGVWMFRRSLLAPALRRVSPDNAAGEIHLGGAIEVLVSTGHTVGTHEPVGADEVTGVNDRIQLADAEAELRRRTNAAWLARGVTMLDPARTYVDATVELAPDVTLFPGTILQGSTTVGEGCEIGPDTRLVDCRIGSGSRIEKTMAEAAVIGADCHVGPFAVLAAGTEIPSTTVTGPFYTAGTEAS